MPRARTAIHLCTGQHADIEVLHAWLERHGVEVIRFDDVYQLCAYLLRHYEHVPDLALVGTDWLMEGEFNVIAYLRQTWPRVGIVIYGSMHETPLFELLPRTRTCRGSTARDALTRSSPDEVLSALMSDAASTTTSADLERRAGSGRLSPDEAAYLRPESEAATPPSPSPGTEERDEEPRQALKLSNTESPRSILTAEELAALLDLPDRK